MDPWLDGLWPTQVRTVESVNAIRCDGVDALALCSPTGSGKTVLMSALARQEIARVNGSVAIFANRKLLTKQASRVLKSHGVQLGHMAAGFDEALLSKVQVCSIQTIDARVFEQNRWRLPRASLVMIDEAHSNTGAVGQSIIRHYKQQGSFIIGPTATPVGLGGLYSKLLVAATKKELREQGKLVRCDVFAPDEPDASGVRKEVGGEYTDREGMVRKIMQTVVRGDVFKNLAKYNPNLLPTIVFAPGVAESRWLCREFNRRGIKAAHIDADTPTEERDQIFSDHEIGDIKVICSFGVLREGADLPWLFCGILLQPCRKLSTYLQVVGRLLRCYEGKTHAILIDHAGAWHRHGSPNKDHDWKLECTNESMALERKKRQQNNQEDEPIRCPQCSGIRASGPKCPHCGFQHTKSVRMIRMEDGELKPVVGRVSRERKQVSEHQRLWTSSLWRAALSKRPLTVAQAVGMFKKSGGTLTPDLEPAPPTPRDVDWNRLVTKVYPTIGRKKP